MAEVDKMIELGLFENPAKYELIDGVIIEKMGHGDLHFSSLSLAFTAPMSVFTHGFSAMMQSPLKMSDDTAPEPDIAIYVGKQTPRPTPDDLAMVVEVSDSTLILHLGKKASIYARLGISEYWVLDVHSRKLVCHRNPSDGIYASVLQLAERISPLAKPEVTLNIADLFPPIEE